MENSQAIFYVVATPIGNLEDITLRALRILKEVDIIYCEDTRTTRVLLNKYEIRTKCESYHTHSTDAKENNILENLRNGNKLALVSDAGTPAISDPGTRLIAMIREYLPEVKIESVPGASALSAFMSISGVHSDSYTFYGFVPHKKGRQTLIIEMLENQNASIVYESTHRVEKLMQEIKKEEQGSEVKRKIVIGRELTKMFEDVFSGTADEILELFAKDKNKLRGEFVVMIV
jgi:16S rRNA (cytidine1402-2'-O)-methyltransferase